MNALLALFEACGFKPHTHTAICDCCGASVQFEGYIFDFPDELQGMGWVAPDGMWGALSCETCAAEGYTPDPPTITITFKAVDE